MPDGSFTPAARAIIYEAGLWRCVGCGRTDLTAQHRRARGMGGTTDLAIGHPANGVPLCGSGTTGCHGWVEHHPVDALFLGYRLEPGAPALGTPWWNRSYAGWTAWHQATDGFISIHWIGDPDHPAERTAALTRLTNRNNRITTT